MAFLTDVNQNSPSIGLIEKPATSKIIPFSSGKSVSPEKNFINEAVKRIAKETFIELGILLATTVVSCFFIATLEGMVLLTAAAVTVAAFNLIVRIAREFFYYQMNLPDNSQSSKKWFRICHRVCNWTVASQFANFDSATRGTLVHEGGHAITASLLFQNANPSITLTPLTGGVTKFSLGALTSLGERIGKTAARAIISAAGTVFGIGMSCIDITIAHFIRTKHPKVSSYLNSCATTNITNSVLYALSAYTITKMTGHDFVALWKLAGINPIAAAVVIVAVPLFLKLSLIAFDKTRKFVHKYTQPIEPLLPSKINS